MVSISESFSIQKGPLTLSCDSRRNENTSIVGVLPHIQYPRSYREQYIIVLPDSNAMLQTEDMTSHANMRQGMFYFINGSPITIT